VPKRAFLAVNNEFLGCSAYTMPSGQMPVCNDDKCRASGRVVLHVPPSCRYVYTFMPLKFASGYIYTLGRNNSQSVQDLCISENRLRFRIGYVSVNARIANRDHRASNTDVKALVFVASPGRSCFLASSGPEDDMDRLNSARVGRRYLR
jgi:hypothetical protein